MLHATSLKDKDIDELRSLTQDELDQRVIDAV